MDNYSGILSHYDVNLAVFTRQVVQILRKLYFDDEEVFKFETVNFSTREGAVLAANHEETIHDIVATPSIPEGAVPAAVAQRAAINGETNRLYMVATHSIREGIVLAVIVRGTVDNEESTTLVEQSNYYKTSEILQNTTKQTGCYNSMMSLFIVDYKYHAILSMNDVHIYVHNFLAMLCYVLYMCETYCVSMRQLMHSGDIELNPSLFSRE